jgi:hypothetical protein
MGLDASGGYAKPETIMLYVVFKAALSGVIVAIVSEASKRSPVLGGMIASLPLVSILAFIWLWRDTADTAGIAAQAEATFWFVLPSLPMFLVLPALLRGGTPFWMALAASCALTMLLYVLTAWILSRFGIAI